MSGNTPATTDGYGHGTHVAGIIAGQTETATVVRPQRDERNDGTYLVEQVKGMAGMVPMCQLVSYRVLNERGDGNQSAILAALNHINEVNANGRDLKINGVNLSVGYPFDPEWFACGQSPLCVEVGRRRCRCRRQHRLRLQQGFLRRGFRRCNGFFRQIIDNQTVRGQVVITKTANDKAVGFAYAVASRISNDPAAGVGDAGDKFGGIGRNGVLKTTEAVDGELLPVGGAYASGRGLCTTCSPTSSSPITPR